jgi:hypothetical protein
MKRVKRLNRRTFLRGAGGIAIGLPLLDLMDARSVWAQTPPTAPRRIIFSFKANGDEIARRFAAPGETDFQLGEFLAPLEPYRSDLLFLNKLDKRFRMLEQSEQSDGHQQGGSALAPWTSGEGSYPIGGTDRKIGYVLGPSADYAIGERVLASSASPPPHRHLVYRVGQKNNDIWNLHSHAGPEGKQSPVPPETDPYAAYTRIFTFNDDPAAQAALRERLQKQQSALDLVLAETSALEARLGADDRQRMQQHTEAIRDIERSLSGPLAGSSCGPLELGAKLDPYNNDNYLKIGHLFFDIMTLAFACDLTRVVQFNWSGNTNNRVYKTLGLSAGHHDISHEGTPESFVNIRKIHKHLWESTVPLYDKLKAAGEAGDSLWDNTLVVHWNELGQGDSHTIRDNLVVLAGGAQNHFRRGRMLDFNNQASFADMLVSCFHYMGFDDVTSFGDPRLQQTGALSGLT